MSLRPCVLPQLHLKRLNPLQKKALSSGARLHEQVRQNNGFVGQGGAVVCSSLQRNDAVTPRWRFVTPRFSVLASLLLSARSCQYLQAVAARGPLSPPQPLHPCDRRVVSASSATSHNHASGSGSSSGACVGTPWRAADRRRMAAPSAAAGAPVIPNAPERPFVGDLGVRSGFADAVRKG